jgi:hypothetical protein
MHSLGDPKPTMRRAEVEALEKSLKIEDERITSQLGSLEKATFEAVQRSWRTLMSGNGITTPLLI